MAPGAGEPGLVSVIIPARNAAATIGDQLAALSRQTYPGQWEVVVVDNGSTDRTAEVVGAWQARLPRLRRLAAPAPAGANHARNHGCRGSRGELLLFCDHDDRVDRDWVAAMTAGLHRYHAVGGFVERELLNDEVALATRPQRPGLRDGFGFLPYPLAANCGVRRSLWVALGGFRAGYPRASEDVEFFWRAQLAGFAVGYLPDAIVHYRLRPDLPGMVRQYYTYGRSHPQLFRDFAGYGMPASGGRAALGAWLRLVLEVGALARSRRDRAVWLTRAAMRCGRLAGSLRHRVWYL